MKARVGIALLIWGVMTLGFPAITGAYQLPLERGFLRSMVYLEMRLPEMALYEMEATDPELMAQPEVRLYYAMLCSYLGKYQEAAEHYRLAEKAAESSGAEPEQRAAIMTAMADNLLMGGDIRGALDTYQKAVLLAPGVSRAHLGLGIALASVGDVGKASREFETASSINPGFAEPLVELGKLIESAGNTASAIAAYQRAVEASPELPGPHYLLGSALLKTGDPERARQELETALRLKPGYEPAKELLESLGPAR